MLSKEDMALRPGNGKHASVAELSPIRTTFILAQCEKPKSKLKTAELNRAKHHVNQKRCTRV